ncbi:hypothetical protein HZH68_005517 [Vespula germanica]|uniref:Uncharacterized protein n=1 Tax=Vespula germanica TaxID=30212 RepID=A0A834KGC6_VESGE|nr:hypothetical protein HZH68_005517 [Vespula germanica]
MEEEEVEVEVEVEKEEEEEGSAVSAIYRLYARVPSLPRACSASALIARHEKPREQEEEEEEEEDDEDDEKEKEKESVSTKRFALFEGLRANSGRVLSKVMDIKKIHANYPDWTTLALVVPTTPGFAITIGELSTLYPPFNSYPRISIGNARAVDATNNLITSHRQCVVSHLLADFSSCESNRKQYRRCSSIIGFAEDNDDDDDDDDDD